MDWDYLGDYRPGLFEEPGLRPQTGVLFCGWARKIAAADPVHGPSDDDKWVVAVDDEQLLLACSFRELFFLTAASADGFSCWVAGQLLCTAGR
ncbi:MAG: hypothetical protein EBU31_15985, partial [Proteobacteria bacterium]|nr:hypothetical protein [Pseudomonadota bacterium]